MISIYKRGMKLEEKKVSKSVLKRLPIYLSYLKSIPEPMPENISATTLAAALGMGEVQVRKDLAIVSNGGRPKIGYCRERLIDDIEQFLGYDNTTVAVLIGAGRTVPTRSWDKWAFPRQCGQWTDADRTLP